MMASGIRFPMQRLGRRTIWAGILLLSVFVLPTMSRENQGNKEKSKEPLVTKLRIEVTGGAENKPVVNASVYVRYSREGGFLFRKEKEVEMNLKTDLEGGVKVPEIPRGKVLIQVVAPGWHTFGKWYTVEKERETIQIKLKEPHRWY